MQKKLFIANWKLNHSRKTASEFFEAVLKKVALFSSSEIAIAPVAPMLDFVGKLISGTNLFLAAQNVFYAEKGAFTGEWSSENLSELFVKYCIVGHSERRQLFYESDQDVQKKTKACLRARIIPVICVGESEAERTSKKTWDVIKRQVLAVLDGLENDSSMPLVFAYEPIWAIGTGKAATLPQVQEVHGFLRELMGKSSIQSVASSVRILYGGSVNGENIKEIVEEPDVDGVLVGGASLQADTFLSMVEMLHDAKV